MAKAKTVKIHNSVDVIMQNVALSMIRDFRRNFDDHEMFHEFEAAIRTRDPITIREAVPAIDMSVKDSLKFKAIYQMHSIFKRYRFEKDLYSDDELIEQAISSFQSTQDRLRALDLENLPFDSKLVLAAARSYITQVLGEYSDEEHRNLCRFGKRASVGVPARLACEAARWQIPVSGSQEQIDWFDSEMSQICEVQEYWNKQKGSDLTRSTYQPTSSLALALVPKTFKSLRSIMPNTTIGSYMSFGLGEMIRRRLKAAGYDIRSLQMTHRYLARRGSEVGFYCTADLSSASDSISVALVEKLLPPDWLFIMNQSRIGSVSLPNGDIVNSLTYCTMGIGYTFPLQTLIFLALLKGIEAVHFDSNDRRTISVFGDDLIYFDRQHAFVERYFKEFGFVLNVDKTFHDGPFRESCGGDYHHGLDVRPFQPRNGPANISGKAYEAVLYKFINGLLMRWSEYEIEGTLRYLASEIEAMVPLKVVPGDYPDDSGIKCPVLGYWSFLQYFAVAKPKFVGHGVYRFSYLRLKSDLREEKRHEPYYWVALRGGAESVFDYTGQLAHQGYVHHLVRLINDLTGVDIPEPQLIEAEDPVKFVRSCITGRRLRRKTTFVTVSHTGRYTRQYGTSCFEDRR